MADSDFDKITPADITLSGSKSAPEAVGQDTPPLGVEELRRKDERQKAHTRILAGIFALLLVVVGGVIFILPKLISPPDPASSQVVVVDTRPAGSAATANQVSPFEEAQKLRQRETAQTILAELLDLQESLEKQDVDKWAGEQMNRVFELAREGDEAYRAQEFIRAGELYQEGLEILADLDNDLPNVFQRYLETGEQAILDGDPALAEASFSTAILINPDSRSAVDGYDRALILDDVLALVEQGRALHEQGSFEEARDFYQQALAMDPRHVGATEGRAQANRDILERDFSAAMSRGFAALAQERPEQAETAFREALTLKPDSPEAIAALDQTVTQMTLSAINVHLDAATEHEAAEAWDQAVSEYDQALAIDPNVVSAQQGKRRASDRLELDTYLKGIVNNPLRLADDEVFDQAVDVYNDSISITPMTTRLNTQLLTLRGYLEKVEIPVPVRLQSDGITQVTLYRVGELGQFTSRSLELTPGNYVAVGIRDGYRDVREEFVVGFDGQPPVVTVQCDEEVL